jgi:hypothetical protein
VRLPHDSAVLSDGTISLRCLEEGGRRVHRAAGWMGTLSPTSPRTATVVDALRRVDSGFADGGWKGSTTVGLPLVLQRSAKRAVDRGHSQHRSRKPTAANPQARSAFDGG